MKYDPQVFLVTVTVMVLGGGMAPLAGQERPSPRFELGLTYGTEHLTRMGDDVTASGFQSLQGAGGYFGLFFSPRLLLTTELGGTFGEGVDSFHMGSELRHLFSGSHRSSPYVSVGVAASWGDRSVEANPEWALGIGAGYRLLFTDRLSLNLGALHRQWFHDRVGQTSLTLGFGVNLGGKR